MIFIVLVLLFTIILFFIFFVSKRFSPVPYFPSNRQDLTSIVKSLDLKNNQTVIDLGAGDGIVIFEAAKNACDLKLNTKFVAVDINPILVTILHLRRLFHPNKKNIKIVRGDFFKIKLFDLTPNPYTLITVYLYISPWFLDEVSKKILKEFPKVKIVSYMYPIVLLKKKETITRSKNSIFIYQI